MPYSFGYRGSIVGSFVKVHIELVSSHVVLGPEFWSELDLSWGLAKNGKRQSPINICPKEVHVSPNLHALKYDWQYDENITVVNSGFSPTFYVSKGKHFLIGGPLQEEYELVQFHLHFSSTEDKGSEHSIDGRYYAAEIHFVHFKKAYGSFEEAVLHCDGLAVVGAFIGIDNNGNENASIDKSLLKLMDVAEVGEQQKLSIDLSMVSLTDREYYTYSGSLTTPGCAECVNWIVLDQPIYITSQAHDALKSLKSAEGGLQAYPGNYRPVQPIHDRIIYASFDPNRAEIGYD